MARKPLIRQHLHPYHVYNRVNSCRFYPRSLMDEIWNVYCDSICILTWVFGVRVHGLVLMGNHYHMMISTPDANLDAAMLYFHREVSRQIKALVGFANQDFRFQSRYRWKIIENGVQYENTYRYIAQNPQLGEPDAEFLNYPFSTFSGQFGFVNLGCPVFECEAFAGLMPPAEDIKGREDWLWGRVRGTGQ